MGGGPAAALLCTAPLPRQRGCQAASTHASSPQAHHVDQLFGQLRGRRTVQPDRRHHIVLLTPHGHCALPRRQCLAQREGLGGHRMHRGQHQRSGETCSGGSAAGAAATTSDERVVLYQPAGGGWRYISQPCASWPRGARQAVVQNRPHLFERRTAPSGLSRPRGPCTRTMSCCASRRASGSPWERTPGRPQPQPPAASASCLAVCRGHSRCKARPMKRKDAHSSITVFAGRRRRAAALGRSRRRRHLPSTRGDPPLNLQAYRSSPSTGRILCTGSVAHCCCCCFSRAMRSRRLSFGPGCVAAAAAGWWAGAAGACTGAGTEAPASCGATWVSAGSARPDEPAEGMGAGSGAAGAGAGGAAAAAASIPPPNSALNRDSSPCVGQHWAAQQDSQVKRLPWGGRHTCLCEWARRAPGQILGLAWVQRQAPAPL